MENYRLLDINSAHYHAWFHHKQADGWITMAKKTETGFKQYHYQPDELAVELSKWIGEDVYFSQNTFYRPQRKIENIRQLRSLYVDLDCYLLNYDPKWVLGKLELEIFKETLPDPNLIIFSGRGLVCVWLIDPVPYKALPLWQAIQEYFVKQLQEVGGDPKATDAARVFRIAGSVNSKNGEQVNVQYRHSYRYPLREIQHDYLPELKLERKVKKRGRPNKITSLFNTYSLHHARLLDIVKLVEIRNYDVKGYRETLCFLYRYWQCCYLSDSEEAIRHTLDFNYEFLEPLSEKEVIRATRSAEKAWQAKRSEEANKIAKEKGYPGAGYNLKNSKIIEWLNINQEEQRFLKTIIDGVEKRRRKREKDKLQKREQRGSVTREEYLKQEQQKTMDKLCLLQKELNKNPRASQKELAKLLNVERSYISKLQKKMEKKGCDRLSLLY